MPSRLRLYDLRNSRLPNVIGSCQADISTIARYANGAQRRLIYAKEGGDEGWWGTWAEVLFAVDPTKPNITLPRELARLEQVNVCNRPVPVNNQFYEYLQFGNGRLPKQRRTCPGLITVNSRNNSVTFRDMTNPPQFIRVVITSPADVGKRVLLQGTDNNSVIFYSQDGLNQVTGIFLNLDSPFVQSPFPLMAITGIQKDITAGQVQFFQVDPNTGDQILLLTMEPGEQTAFYRRYFLNPLPRNCCFGFSPICQTPNVPSFVQVTAIAKLELLPLVVDTDYCLIQNLEAIIEECSSIRYSEVDTPASKAMSKERHLEAIGLLNGELNHYLGKDSPAVNVFPFGTARLSRAGIGRVF